MQTNSKEVGATDSYTGNGVEEDDNQNLSWYSYRLSASFDPNSVVDNILQDTFVADIDTSLREFEEFFSGDEWRESKPNSTRPGESRVNSSKDLQAADELDSTAIMDRGSAFEMFGEPVPPPQDTTEIELQETNPNTENGLYTTESSTVSEEQARTAFQNYVQRHHFYGRCAANDCVIDTIRCVDAFHYMLETFTEARSTKLIEQPYEGDTESDEGPDGTDSVPEPWDIEVEPQKLFENNSVHLPVPNSEQIKPCSNCLGSCKTTCSFCDGAGSAMCLSCGGEGSVKSNVKPADGEETKMEDCTTCDGKGRKGCSPCSESGEIGCSKCEAKGKLKTHLELIVIWKNNWDDYIVDYVGAVPEKVLRQLQGKIAFSEEKRKISPLSDFPNNDIVMASKELVEGHHSDFINQRILKQRHQVRVVPISDIKYTYKEKKLNFYVYGENRDNVYAPNYPQRYCCCSVM